MKNLPDFNFVNQPLQQVKPKALGVAAGGEEYLGKADNKADLPEFVMI